MRPRPPPARCPTPRPSRSSPPRASYDQVRLGHRAQRAQGRIGASHGGVSLGEDGASHQMIEDIALMRAMPKMQVVVPADYNQAYTRGDRVLRAIRRADVHALRPARRRRSSTTRSPRRSAPASTSFARARTSRSSPAATWSGADWRRPRPSSARTGWRPRSSTSRSSSRSTRRACSSSLAKTGVAVTAEEHRVVGGLGDAIRQVAAEQHPVPVFALGMQRRVRRLRHRRGLHGALRPHRQRHRRPGPRGACSRSRSCSTRRFTAGPGPLAHLRLSSSSAARPATPPCSRSARPPRPRPV